MFLDAQPRYTYRQPRFGLAAARLWLVFALLISGGLSLDTGISAQRQLAHAEDAGTLPVVSTASQSSVSQAAQVVKVDSTNSSRSSTATNALSATGQPAESSTIAETKQTPSFLSYSEPIAISLPSVGIQSSLITVGKTATGEMEVPEYPNFDKAAWYRESPTPGQYGSSIILGHVDSYASNNGASVFFSLPKVKVGDPIVINRTDGSTVNFIVRAIRNYNKADMPDDIIYGPVTEDAELRLITCSGKFIHETGTYDSNTVVFATMKR